MERSTGIVLILIIVVIAFAMNYRTPTQKFCTACGTIGEGKRRTKGHFIIELVLWCLFLVPGLIYTVWRLSSQGNVCESCGAETLIPLDSPVAIKMRQELSKK